MEKIPTAEEYLLIKKISRPKGEFFRLDLSRDGHAKTEKDIQTAMVEFAKLHVEAALKAAAEELPYDDKLNQDMILKKSIINSYPLENIK